MTNQGMQKLLLIIVAIAVVALVAVEIARVTGYLPDWSLFVTLNIALPVLIVSMGYQVYLRRKQDRAP
jgi:predicted benzoate:H+ symporter BenE